MKKKLLWVGISFTHLVFAQTPDSSRVDTTQTKKYTSEEIVISGTRANEMTPVTQYNLNQAQIKEKYYGADVPFLLQQAPSINSHSDAGNGIGYSFLRIRGIDFTRINLSINGIPINDPENQGFFFNNFADILSSAKSIQVQRGVGTSSNGTAALGGQISVVTRDMTPTPEAEVSMGAGSFNSQRVSAQFQTGLIQQKFAFQGRLSQVNTDGYRYRSGTLVRSYLFSGAYFGKKSLLKFTMFGGQSNSNLAFAGIDEQTMAIDRRTNPLTAPERDQFNQNFYQLQYTYEFNKKLSLSAQAYYVKGVAPYFTNRFYSAWGYDYTAMNLPQPQIKDSLISGSDFLGSYKLNQDYLGAMAFLHYSSEKWNVSGGIHANGFKADHFMTLDWAQVLPAGYEQGHLIYFNTGYKNEINGIVKTTYNVNTRLSLFLDLQLRHATFRYVGKDQAVLRDTFAVEPMAWTFFNPKWGVRYALTDKASVYAHAGLTSREPTRLDFIQNSYFYEFPQRKISQSDIKPESVWNVELGFQSKQSLLDIQANLFWMRFKNQIVGTGQLNGFGAPITSNVPWSTRAGLELDATLKLTKWLSLPHSSSWMYSSFDHYTQYYTIVNPADTSISYTQTPALLTPAIMVNQGIRFTYKSFQLEFMGRFVDKQYLTNTKNENLTLPSYFVGDVRFSADFSSWVPWGRPVVSLQFNNVTNTLYTPFGSISGNTIGVDATNQPVITSVRSFNVAAPFNFFATLHLHFK